MPWNIVCPTACGLMTHDDGLKRFYFLLKEIVPAAIIRELRHSVSTQARFCDFMFAGLRHTRALHED